jgi:hypothetical protein
MGRIKVKQQASVFASEFEVGEELCFVNRGDTLDGLEFNDEKILDQKVDAVADIKLH